MYQEKNESLLTPRLMSNKYTRREMLALTGQALAAGALGSRFCLAAEEESPTEDQAEGRFGAVAGHAMAAKIGREVLTNGGNAVDAAVAAALTACVVTPTRCGIGGYGGHLTLALAGGRKVTSIDFNTMAPAAARQDMYPLDEQGEVKERVNFHGWLAAGVPGILAGLQLALHRYGTRSFRELAQPAIELARNGFTVTEGFARSIRGALARFRNDPGSAKLYLIDGEPPKAGDLHRNPELADLLATLAKRNSVDSFYRGDIAQRVAEAFQKNGGLVTAKDMAAYKAREMKPLQMKWKNCAVHTAPLTAGGLTVLEALSILKALGWDGLHPSPAAAHAWLEALRVAWHDRLRWLGDPEKVKVPVSRLLSSQYARETATKIKAAVNAARPLDIEGHDVLEEEGTVNISSVDRRGNMVAMTLTHGGTFGAQITVDGLGLTLGHGMSRFRPQPGHPNAPGPGKRPLNNMCPSVVLRDGKPVLALGGAGGLRIPNGIYAVLTHCLERGEPMTEAVAAPRLHCTGTLEVTVERSWPKAEADYLAQIGFAVRNGTVAHISAVSFNPQTGECRGVMR